MTAHRWTTRDIAILEALTFKVRLMSLAQIAKTWWGHCRRPNVATRRALNRFIKADLLIRQRINAHPILCMRKPIVYWRMGDSPPNCHTVAWSLQKRWTGLPS